MFEKYVHEEGFVRVPVSVKYKTDTKPSICKSIYVV